MRSAVARMLTLLACLLVVYMAISVVANISQIANAADRISMGLGQPVFWTLSALIVALLIAPIVVFFRLPKPLIAPSEGSGPEHEKYVRALRIQLARNPLIAG